MANQTRLAHTLFTAVADFSETSAVTLLRQLGDISDDCQRLCVINAIKDLDNAGSSVEEDDTRPFEFEERSETDYANERLTAESLAELKDALSHMQMVIEESINETLDEVIKRPEPPQEPSINGARYFSCHFTEINSETEYKTRFLMVVPPGASADNKLHRIFSSARGECIEASEDYVEFEGGLAAKKPCMTEITEDDFNVLKGHLTVH